MTLSKEKPFNKLIKEAKERIKFEKKLMEYAVMAEKRWENVKQRNRKKD